jgi:hypothetical protein
MTRSTTTTGTPTAKPAAAGTAQAAIPHERIAQRAYEKWIQRGRPQGTDMQDWIEAEAELRAEATRSTVAATTNAAAAGKTTNWTSPTGQRY